ncbi:MAG: DUF5723 family protein [Bacteroidetes bacterium]|nr:DUF5723 family protein [Bacteroidota bacterium]
MNMKRIAIAAALILLSPLAVWAQHPMGLVVGDLNTPYAYSLNPALTRSSLGNRAFFNWWGGSLALSPEFDMNLDQRWNAPNPRNGFHRMNAMNEVYGPSFFLPLGPRASFGFGVKAVSGLSLNGVSENWALLLRNGGSITDFNSLSQGAFSINTDQYQEWFFSFSGESGAWSDGWSARSLAQRTRAYRWGVTPKFIIGMGAASLNGTAVNLLNMAQVGNSVTADAQDVRMRLQYTNDASASTTLDGPWGLNFRIPYGAGMGVDLGFVYEYRPHAAGKFDFLSPCDWEEQQQYEWKFGASITDLGLIWYDGESQTMNRQGSSLTYQPTLISGPDERFSTLGYTVFVANNAETEPGFISYTPAALNMQFDKRLQRYGLSGENVPFHWHIGAYWTQDLKAVNSSGLHRASYFSVVPRHQSERFEYGFPVSLTNQYQNLQVGAYVRIGPLTLGSDNLVGYKNWQTGKTMGGANFYFGVRSKLGDCLPWYEESYVEPTYDQNPTESNKTCDTVYVDRVQTIRDTVYTNSEYRIDTLRIETVKVIRDTLFKEAPVSPVDPVEDRVLEDTKKKLAVVEAELAKEQKRNKDLQDQWLEEKKRCDEALAQEEDKRKKAEISAEEAKNRADGLEQDRDRLQFELDRLKQVSGSGCEEQTRLLDSFLAIEQKKNQNLAAELSKVKNERDRAVSDLAACQKRSDECLKSLGAVEAERDRLKSELEALKLKLAVPVEDCAPIKKKLSETEAQLKALQSELNGWKTKAQLCEEELAKAKNTAADLEMMVNTKQKEIDALKAQLAASSGEDCSSYKTKIAQLEAQLAAVEDCAPYKNQVSDLKAQLAAVEDCVPYKKQVSDLKAQLAAVEDCAPYKKKVSDLEAQLSKAQTDLANEKKKVSDLQAQLADCSGEDDCEQISSDLEAAKKKITALEAENEKLKADKSQLESDLSAAKSQYNAVMAEYEVCNKAVQELKSKLADCEKQLKEAGNNNSDAALNEAKAEIAKLKQTLAQLNAEIDSQAETIQTCQSSNSDLQLQLKASQDAAAKLKSQLADATKQLQLVKLQLDECQKAKEVPPAPEPAGGGN